MGYLNENGEPVGINADGVSQLRGWNSTHVVHSSGGVSKRLLGNTHKDRPFQACNQAEQDPAPDTDLTSTPHSQGLLDAACLSFPTLLPLWIRSAYSYHTHTTPSSLNYSPFPSSAPTPLPWFPLHLRTYPLRCASHQTSGVGSAP